MLPASPTLAALIPAFVGAFVALITIIITKEQKVSEFRQAWINAFRDDIADAISAASTLSVILQTGGDEDLNDKHKEWSRFTAALARIELRLNLDETLHQQLERCIRKAEVLFESWSLSLTNTGPSSGKPCKTRS